MKGNQNLSKVSIVITHYNQPTLIVEAILSVLNQTYTNWELVLVDDGSSEDNVSLLVKNLPKDDRINIITQPNNGACIARNTGLQNASGDFVIFLDGDDLISETCFANRVALLEQNLELDFVVTQGAVFYKSQGDDDRLISSKTNLNDHVHQFLQLDVPWVNFGPTWRRKSLLKYNHTWDPEVKVYQDVDFHIRALLKGMKYSLDLGEPDAFWRWGQADNIGGKRLKPEMVKSNARLWTSIASQLKGSEHDTEENRGALKRHLFELVLNFIRKNNFSQASENLKILTKYWDSPEDLKLLKRLLRIGQYPLPLNKIGLRVLYELRIKRFHRYENKYFLQTSHGKEY